MQLLMNCEQGIFHGSPACDDISTMDETRPQGIHFGRFTFARFHQNQAAEGWTVYANTGAFSLSQLHCSRWFHIIICEIYIAE